MSNNNLLKIYRGLSYLYSDFESEIFQLNLTIKQEGMPFFLYETYRTPQRQKFLYKKGFSTERDFMANPHVNGLAADFLIDKRKLGNSTGDSKTIQEIVEQTLETMSDTDNRGEVYDIGTNLLPEAGKKERTIVQNALVLYSWNKLGEIIKNQFPNLTWGGDRALKEGQLIGVDPPHVEFRDAKRLIRNKESIKQISSKGAPGLR